MAREWHTEETSFMRVATRVEHWEKLGWHFHSFACHHYGAVLLFYMNKRAFPPREYPTIAEHVSGIKSGYDVADADREEVEAIERKFRR